MVLFICHSAFLHQHWLGDSISLYVKMHGINLLLKRSKELHLSQSLVLQSTFYKVDFYIFVWRLITSSILTITKCEITLLFIILSNNFLCLIVITKGSKDPNFEF